MPLIVAMRATHAQPGPPYPNNGRVLFAGANAGAPLKLGGYVGVTVARDSVGDPPMHFSGPTALVAAGLGGARVALGIGSATDAGTGRLLLAAIRTWRKPWFAASNATYLGVELERATLLGLSAGLYVRVTPGNNRRVFVSANLLAGY